MHVCIHPCDLITALINRRSRKLEKLLTNDADFVVVVVLTYRKTNIDSNTDGYVKIESIHMFLKIYSTVQKF